MSYVRRPSAATVISCIALGIALGGTSYAAVVLPKNSVGTAQLKKDAVVSSKVLNGSLTADDFKAGQLPAGLTGAAGATGPAGPMADKGATGDTGAQGAPGLSALQIVTASSVNDNLGGLKEATATCPSGKKAIGGGAESISSKAISSSGYPVGDNAWKAEGYAGFGAFYGVKAYAVCATVAG